jgi:DNA polymerase II small subunit
VGNLLSGNQRAQNAVRALLKAGIQISPEALSYLALQSDPIRVATRTLEELDRRKLRPLIITRNLLEEVSPTGIPVHFRIIRPGDLGEPNVVNGKNIRASVEILSPLYEDSSSEGKLENFVAHFRDRYDRLRKLFKARKDAIEAITVEEALKSQKENKVKVIGIATSKRETHNRSIIIDLEDPTGIISALISGKDDRLYGKASRVLLDQVICVEGVPTSEKAFSVRDIAWADVPYDYKPNKAKEPVYAVLISDVHYGSSKFLKEEFEQFISWLRGEGPTDEAVEVARQVKYLIIAGDLVDGIGVYPGQEEELDIKDIYAQYEQLAEYIRRIPLGIEIIAIPGNHDATRLSLPQPPVPEKYIKPLTNSCSNFHMLGNPAFVKIHEVGTLIYHGKIIDNILSSLPEISEKTVNQALHELIRCRHLAPTWDPDNPITPTNDDVLVMERIPDILHMGHIHINAVSQYRNILTVNSGTFQSQTSYQKSMGVKPTPGIIEVVNLMTLKPAQIQFSNGAY